MTSPPPPAYRVNCALPSTREEAAYCDQHRAIEIAQHQARVGDAQLWIAGLGAIFLLVTLIYTAKAAIAAEKAARVAQEAVKGTDAALLDAGRSADAAVKLADTAEETMRRQLRAYVYLSAVHVNFMGLRNNGPPDRAEVTITLENYGQTPAKCVRFRARAFVGPYWTNDFPADLDQAVWINAGDLPPGELREQNGYFVTGDVKANWPFITTATASIFVEGVVEYESGQVPYTTKFRVATSGVATLARDFVVTPGWNEAD